MDFSAANTSSNPAALLPNTSSEQATAAADQQPGRKS